MSLERNSDAANIVNPFALLVQRRFLPYFLTQFLGAFNDNVFKSALIIIIAFDIAVNIEGNVDTLTNLSAGLFILPFFLFSALAGQLVDKYEKARVIVRIKLLEIVIMMLAALAFYMELLLAQIGVLFLMGLQSTLFGPAKYSYLPQHLTTEELTAGNALVQTGTFVAIIAGTMIGGLIVTIHKETSMLSFYLITISILGLMSSLFIPKTSSLVPDLKIRWNLARETLDNISFISQHRKVMVAVLGISWFWFLGATYLVQLPNYTKQILGGDEQVVTLLLTLFTLSVGMGSLLCHWLSRGKIEIAIVLLGSAGLTIFGIDLYLAQPVFDGGHLIGAAEFLHRDGSLHVLFDIAAIGVSAGLYIVPLFSHLQHIGDSEHLSRIIAGNNILNALFMVVASVMAILLLSNGLGIDELLLVTTCMNALMALFLIYADREYLERLVRWSK